MIDWRDLSSRGKAGSTFEWRSGRVKLIVTRHIHYEPDEWIATCEPFFSARSIVRGSDSTTAKLAALGLLKKHLETVMVHL